MGWIYGFGMTVIISGVSFRTFREIPIQPEPVHKCALKRSKRKPV
jgi:hypothetical protein